MEEKKTEQKEDDVRGAILVVSADVIEGREAEFNKWYDEHHIPLFSGKIPHLKRVRRFYSKRANPSFITIYEFETSPLKLRVKSGRRRCGHRCGKTCSLLFL